MRLRPRGARRAPIGAPLERLAYIPPAAVPRLITEQPTASCGPHACIGRDRYGTVRRVSPGRAALPPRDRPHFRRTKDRGGQRRTILGVSPRGDAGHRVPAPDAPHHAQAPQGRSRGNHLDAGRERDRDGRNAVGGAGPGVCAPAERGVPARDPSQRDEGPAVSNSGRAGRVPVRPPAPVVSVGTSALLRVRCAATVRVTVRVVPRRSRLCAPLDGHVWYQGTTGRETRGTGPNAPHRALSRGYAREYQLRSGERSGYGDSTRPGRTRIAPASAAWEAAPGRRRRRRSVARRADDRSAPPCRVCAGVAPRRHRGGVSGAARSAP